MDNGGSGQDFFASLMNFFNEVNGVIWADWVLYTVLGVGVLFTLWTGFCQFRALFHGTAVTAGKYDDKDDPGAINHFQALSAALSATVGLGNIGGVAVAIALHNVPEGLAIAVPIYAATRSRSRALLMTLLSGLSEPLGALVGRVSPRRARARALALSRSSVPSVGSSAGRS